MWSKSTICRVWGTVAGAVFGAMFGMVVATHARVAGYLPHVRGQYGSWRPYPIIEGSVLAFAVLGYLMVHTLTSRRTCGHCSGDNPRNAKVCQYCGNSFDKAEDMAMVCLSCRGEYSSGARFCPTCAVELKSVQELKHEARAKNPPVTKECIACGATNMPQRTVCHKCKKPV